MIFVSHYFIRYVCGGLDSLMNIVDFSQNLNKYFLLLGFMPVILTNISHSLNRKTDTFIKVVVYLKSQFAIFC